MTSEPFLITIPLSEAERSFVDAQVAAGSHESASEYVRSLLDVAIRERAKRELEAKLSEGIASGPAVPITDGDWKALRRRVLGDESAADGD